MGLSDELQVELHEHVRVEVSARVWRWGIMLFTTGAAVGVVRGQPTIEGLAWALAVVLVGVVYVLVDLNRERENRLRAENLRRRPQVDAELIELGMDPVYGTQPIKRPDAP